MPEIASDQQIYSDVVRDSQKWLELFPDCWIKLEIVRERQRMSEMARNSHRSIDLVI